jgi:leader peptidase (prepilin peptidase) / N-methyltransferase
MTLFTAVVLGILGSAIGSFLSVVIHRLKNVKKKKKGIILGKSICPHCKKKLKWRHLFPVLSFLFLKGKCAYCGKKIGKHYFALEILTAFLFIAAFLNWNFILSVPSTIDPSTVLYSIDWKVFEVFAFYAIEFSLMAGIFFYDLLYKEIPDSMSIPAIALGLIAAGIFGTPLYLSILIGLAIIAVFFGGQILLSKGEWLGGGDLRIGALLAVLLGWEMTVLALILGYVLGAIISIYLLLSKKATRKTAIPFGPFLIIGGLFALFAGEEIITMYLNLIGL